MWPANETGWTIVLVSVPEDLRPSAGARTTATQAAKAGLHQVGVLDSSRYASLQPGYFVVFTGIYGSQADADAAVGDRPPGGLPGRVLPRDRPLTRGGVARAPRRVTSLSETAQRLPSWKHL